MSTLIAKANTGVGTDQLATDLLPYGHAGVVKVGLGAAGALTGFLGESPLPVSGTVVVDPSAPLAVTQSGSWAVSVNGTVPISAAAPIMVAAQDSTASASLTAAAQTVQIDTTGQTSVGVQVVGTYVGTLIFEGTINGANWVTISGVAVANGAIVSTLASAAQGIWQLSVGSYSAIRVRMATFTSGTATVSLRGSMFGPEAVAIDNPIPAGANAIGTVGVTSISAGTNLIGDVGIQVRANATGAATGYKVLSTASTNAAIIKASAGRLYGYQVMNNGVATAYIKLHNVATLPVAGTTAVATIIAIPPAGIAAWSCPQGVAFTTGIGVTIVGAAADNSAMAVGAEQVCGHLAFS